MKQAIFTAVDNGIDGRGKTRIVFASTSETERDKFVDTHPSGAWYSPDDRVEDLEQIKKATINKLNGLEKLSLGLDG